MECQSGVGSIVGGHVDEQSRFLTEELGFSFAFVFRWIRDFSGRVFSLVAVRSPRPRIEIVRNRTATFESPRHARGEGRETVVSYRTTATILLNTNDNDDENNYRRCAKGENKLRFIIVGPALFGRPAGGRARATLARAPPRGPVVSRSPPPPRRPLRVPGPQLTRRETRLRLISPPFAAEPGARTPFTKARLYWKYDSFPPALPNHSAPQTFSPLRAKFKGATFVHCAFCILRTHANRTFFTDAFAQLKLEFFTFLFFFFTFFKFYYFFFLSSRRRTSVRHADSCRARQEIFTGAP